MSCIQAGRDLEKLIAVIDSCNTTEQLNVAKAMAECYYEKYRNKLDLTTASHARNLITKALDKSSFRVSMYES